MRLHPPYSSVFKNADTETTPDEARTTILSILDHPAARFGTSYAIFIFPVIDPTPTSFDAASLPLRLQSSLIHTLKDYPHFSGQLSWAPSVVGEDGLERGGRAQVRYGVQDSEPGIEFSVVRLEKEAANFLPPAEVTGRNESECGVRVVTGSVAELEPKGQVALWNLKQTHDADGLGLPGIRIQLSILGDGYAVAVKMAHVLGDAQTLVGFVRRWADYTRSLEPGPPPLFDPRMLDAAANQTEVDGMTRGERLASAKSLPCHRYDWHATEAPGYPNYFKGTTGNSIDLAPREEERGDLTIPPWESWEPMKPVDHIQIHFSAQQLKELKEECELVASETGCRISTLDSVLAYTWTLINRARYPDRKEGEQVFLNLSLGARHRIAPPLPENFVGSTMFICHVAEPVSSFLPPTPDPDQSRPATKIAAAIAPLIRRTMEKFTPSALSDLLFDASAEAVPQRKWQAFLGTRHTLVTSWLRLGIWEVDFGDGKPGDVRAVIPNMDGCVQVMEAPARDGKEGGWNVEVYLEREASGRLRQMIGKERWEQ